jgi:hypothetical protein
MTQGTLNWSLMALDFDRRSQRAYGKLGEPIAKPACTVFVQSAFLKHPSSFATFFFGIVFVTLSEEDAIKALFAAYTWFGWMTEGYHLLSDCLVLLVCRSLHITCLDLGFQR